MNNWNEYFCPNCNAILNNQPGFDPDKRVWTCTECGQLVTDDTFPEGHAFPGVVWFCDHCRAVLNLQSGFIDYAGTWRCTECGYVNSLTEDGINNHETIETDDYPDESYDDYGDYTDNDNGFEEYEGLGDGNGLEEYDTTEETENTGSSNDIIQAAAGLSLLLYTAYDLIKRIKKDNRHVASENRRAQYNSSSIHSQEYEAQQYSQSRSNNQNLGILIAGLLFLVAILAIIGILWIIKQPSFSVTNRSDRIQIGYSSEELRNKNYYDVITDLKNQGFASFDVISLEDINVDFLNKDGTIEYISIGEDSSFDSGDWVDITEIVRIKYHSYSKKDKNGYDEDKKIHLIEKGIDISLPLYYEQIQRDQSEIVFCDKENKSVTMHIAFDENQIWSGLKQYDSYYVLKEKELLNTPMLGYEYNVIGKQNNTVYSIYYADMQKMSSNEHVHFAVVVPDNCRMDYSSDIYEIESHVFIPSESDVRIDFTSKEYKDKDYHEVIDTLHNKGFKNVRTEGISDGILGLLYKADSVKQVTINGTEEYQIGDWVNESIEVVVYYHEK